MSWILSIPLYINNWRNGVPALKQNLQLEAAPLRIGILGAAAINWAAIIDPAQTHPGVSLVAIAARNQSRAQAQIDENKLGPGCRAYGSYAELVEDPSIQAVYIPLPNGLHAEWAIKALEAGKHVLIEKPIASNAGEARRIQEAAQKANRVAVEAFHWRFHPAAHTVKAIVESGKYGSPVSIFTQMKFPGGALKKDDIRFRYALAGGAAMDLTYVWSSSTYLGAPDITKCNFEVSRATPRLSTFDKKVDEAIDASFTISQPNKPDIKVHATADLYMPPFLGFIPRLWDTGANIDIELEKATLQFTNFPLSTFGHKITITEKDSGKKTVQSAYKDGPLWGSRGEVWWTTYRYQLEAFVDAVRANERGEKWEGPWMGLDESVKLMSLIDAVYDKTDLPRRGEV